MAEFSNIVLLALHLLCANVAAAGPLLAWRLEFFPDELQEAGRRAAVNVTRLSLAALVAAALLGIALAAVQWNDAFATTWLKTLGRKSFWGGAEALFSALLLTWYLAATRHGAERRGRVFRSVLLALAGTNLLYHFPLLFSIGSLVRHLPELPSEWLDPAGRLTRTRFYAFMSDPGVLSRAAHVAFASLAAAGVSLMAIALRCERTGTESPPAIAALVKCGARWALWASLAQIPVGVLVMLSLPAPWQERALGTDLAALILFGISLMLALIMLQDLASLAFGEHERKLIVRTMILFTLVVACMTGMLRRIQTPLAFPSAGDQRPGTTNGP